MVFEAGSDVLFFKPTRALAESLKPILMKPKNLRKLLYLLQIFVIFA